MKTGRPDLDAMIRVASIPSNEPTFLLRAQDHMAAMTVRVWAELQLKAGVPAAVVEQALRQADAMDAWAVKKAPGADHLTENQAKRLAYELSRRQHAHGSDGPIALAVQIGLEEVWQTVGPFVDLVKTIATLSDPGSNAEANAMIITSLRAVAQGLIEQATAE